MSAPGEAPSGAGLALVVVAAAGFGLAPILVRWLSQDAVGPEVIAFYRFAPGALVMLPFLSLRPGNLAATGMGLIAGVAVGLGWFGYASTLAHTTVATAGIIYMSYPLFTFLFAWLMLGIVPGALAGVAAILVLSAGGLVLDLTSIHRLGLDGTIRALAAPASFGFAAAVFAGWLRRLNPLQRMACVSLGACLGLVALMLVLGQPLDLVVPVSGTIPVVLGLAIAAALVPQFLLMIGAPRTGPVFATIVGTVELPALIVLGGIAFDEKLTRYELLAAGLVIAAIIVAAFSRHSRGRPPGM